jgi:hypothetical protein
VLRTVPCREADPKTAVQDSAEFERALNLTGSILSSLLSLDGGSGKYILKETAKKYATAKMNWVPLCNLLSMVSYDYISKYYKKL